MSVSSGAIIFLIWYIILYGRWEQRASPTDFPAWVYCCSSDWNPSIHRRFLAHRFCWTRDITLAKNIYWYCLETRPKSNMSYTKTTCNFFQNITKFPKITLYFWFCLSNSIFNFKIFAALCAAFFIYQWYSKNFRRASRGISYLVI